MDAVLLVLILRFDAIRTKNRGSNLKHVHEQRITSHLNLSPDQCRYDDRMRVRGYFRNLVGASDCFEGGKSRWPRGVF
jgi:hypothetical protein